MAIEFSCPRCDKHYSLSEALAGKRIACKACGQERTVPAAAAQGDVGVRGPSSAPPQGRAVASVEPTPRETAPTRAGLPRAASKKKRGEVPLLFDNRNMWNGIGGFILVNVGAFVLARVLASGGHVDPAGGAGMVLRLLLFSSVAMILIGLGGAVALLIRGSFSAMLRPLAYVVVGVLGFVALPYTAIGLLPGGRAQEVEEGVADTEESPSSTLADGARDTGPADETHLNLPSNPDAVARELEKMNTKNDLGAISEGAKGLAKLRPDTRRAEIVAAMLAVIDEERGGFGSYSAAEALGVWATAEDLPAMFKRLQLADILVQRALIKSIVRFRDPRTIDLLAAQVGLQNISFEVREALVKFGAKAEPAVILRLKDPSAQVRNQACQVLRQIGSKASLKGLTALTSDRENMVDYQAKQAIDAINKR